MKTEQQLAQQLITIIKSQQPKLKVQGNKLVGTINGQTFELQMYSNNVVGQTTAISR
ncbi:hypothetical protein [Nostoc linckia]|uniref:hypothetical protein n=1 Tax=Nostoc linckia TaxID=92942 RepID=UPI0015D47684|nr:hypothetical protein [Nostoc linckia]